MIGARLLLLVLLHAFLLEAVAPFGVWTDPQWTLWALLMVPPQWSPFGKLGLAFAMGVGLDIALGTYGHHMVAGTLLGGALPFLHRLLAPREGYDVNQRPILRDAGTQWVLTLTLLSAILYHLTLMVVDTWHSHLLASAILPSLTSACWTTLCCMLLHLLVTSPGRSSNRAA